MQQHLINTYSFSELSEDAKESAIERFREHNLDYEWWDYLYEDAKAIASLMGIDIDKIYFSGFSSQGDGACFEGSFSHSIGLLKAVREHAPKDKELHAIAKELQKVKFRGVTANIKQSGHYSHSGCTNINVYQEDEDGYVDDNAEDSIAEEITELLRNYMDWIYKRLEFEYDYLQSDEVIKETIEANEYEFNEDGSMY